MAQVIRIVSALSKVSILSNYLFLFCSFKKITHFSDFFMRCDWLTDDFVYIQRCFCRLLREEVYSLEDVYWLDDGKAHALLGNEFAIWSRGRQRLPATKETLEMFKANLWGDLVESEQFSTSTENASYNGNNLFISCFFTEKSLYSSLSSVIKLQLRHLGLTSN